MKKYFRFEDKVKNGKRTIDININVPWWIVLPVLIVGGWLIFK